MSEQDKQKAGDPAKETFTKADVEKLIGEAVTATKTDMQKHIEKLNKESQGHRLDAKGLKALFAESFGLKEEEVKDTDILNQKIAEIAKQNKELADKYTAAEQKASRLEKLNTAKELAEKAGLKAKAVKLINLDVENLEDELKRIAEEFPELKEKTSTGTGSNPGDPGNTVTANPYKQESFNLTQQFKLETTNPALAAKFKAEAGLK